MQVLAAEDPLLSKVLDKPGDHPQFMVVEGLVYSSNWNGGSMLCIPKGNIKSGKAIWGLILEQAHDTIGHFGEQCTSNYVRHWYWWPHINGDTEQFCKSSTVCQRSKVPNL